MTPHATTPRTTDYRALPRDFYLRSTQTVARELLGKLLVRRWRGEYLVGRITETEGYESHDAACHASRGRTEWTDVMFGDAGHAYVYLIYGMYDCLNIVTEPEHTAAAVLIRSVEPLVGVPSMQRARGAAHLHNLTTGPGKLTRALRITRTLNREDLTTSKRLWVASDDFRVSAEEIVAGPRIGVDYAGEDALRPWRYYLRSSHFVSRRPRGPRGQE